MVDLSANDFFLPSSQEGTKYENPLKASDFFLPDDSPYQGDSKINFNRDDIYTIQNKLNSHTLPFVDDVQTQQYDQSKIEIGKAARYGWYQGWSGALYTTSGIPGWLDRGLDGTINLFGGDADRWAYDYYYGEDFTKDNGILTEADYQKAEDTLRGKKVFRNAQEMPGEPGSLRRASFHALATIDNWEEWLKEKAYGMQPEEREWYRGFRPEGIIEKTFSGFGAAPGMITSIGTATYLTRSPMLGFGLVSFLDQYEEEDWGKVIWNTSLGLIEGKAFGAVATLKPRIKNIETGKWEGFTWRARAGGFATIGASSAGIHGGDYTDVVSGAIVMGAFGVPWTSAGLRAIGIKPKEVDVSKEKELAMEIRDEGIMIVDTIKRTDLHKQETVEPYNKDKKNSGYNREVDRIVPELDKRTTKERKKIAADKKDRGNLEKLKADKNTKKQIERGDDVIKFKRQTETSKEYNQPIDKVRQFDEIRAEKLDKTLEEQIEIQKKEQAELEKRKPVWEDVEVQRDNIIKDGELIDVYVRLTPEGEVAGRANYAERTEGFAPKRDKREGVFPEGSALAFAERYGLKLGKDGNVIAKLSDLIRIKNDKTITNKKWLTKAIKDATNIKTKLEGQTNTRIKEYGKVLNRSSDAANIAYAALMDVAAFKNVGLSSEKSAAEMNALIYEYAKDGSLVKKKDKETKEDLEKDISANDRKGILGTLQKGVRLAERWLLPPKFIGGEQSSRLIKAYISALERMRAETEALVELVDYKKRVVTEKGDVYDQKYIMEEGTVKAGIKLWKATALQEAIFQRGLEGAMTKFEALISRGGKKGVESAERIMRARIDRDNIMYDEAIKNVKGKRTNESIEKEYLSKDKNGKFKYQMAYERLAKEFKLSKEEVEIIQLMDQGLVVKAEIYNAAAAKYKSQEGKPIQLRPNYDPRSWFGRERAFITAKKDLVLESGEVKKAGDTVAVIPAESRNKLNGFLKIFYERNPEFADRTQFSETKFTKSEYGEKSGQAMIDAFETSHRYYDLMPADVVAKLREVEKEFYSKQKFFTAPVHRKGVRGFAGEQPGLSGLQNYIKAHKDYGTGAIRAAKNMEFRHNWEIPLKGEMGQRWRKDFPEQIKVIENYMDNTLGRTEGEVTKVLNKTVEVASDNFRKAVENVPGLRNMPDLLLTANKLTLYSKLLFYNVRFMSAQIVQPWQVIIPKLEQLKIDKGIDGSISEALLKGSYEIFIRSDRDFVKALAYAAERGVIDQKFLKEFNDYVETGGKVKTKGQQNLSTGLSWLTGKELSGKAERFSRMQAFGFMYYFLKSAKRDEVVGKRQMIEEAGELTSNLMVEYNQRNRAQIYGNKGLGVFGSVVGLFKTFQHNYYGKTAEYARTWASGTRKEGGGVKGFTKALTKGYANPMLFHMYSQIFTAGLFGLIAVEQADGLIDWMNGQFAKYGHDIKFNTVSESVLVSDLPMSAKFGLPSKMIGGDMSSTLAAPGMGLSDIFSFPAMDYLFGVQSANHSGVVGESINYTGKKIAGTLTDADVYKFLKVVLPPAFQGEIDRRWGITGEAKPGVSLFGKNGIFNPWREDTRGYAHDMVNNVYYEKVEDKWVIKDPYKGMRGKIKRDAEGFFYKYLAGKSFEESIALKAIWANNKISRNIKTRTEGYVIGASLELSNGRYETAMYFVEALISIGYTYDEAMKKVFNRITMMNNTVIDRIKGLDKPSRRKQSNFLLEVLHNNRLDDSYIPGSAYD